MFWRFFCLTVSLKRSFPPILIFTAVLQRIYPRSSYKLLSHDTRQRRCFVHFCLSTCSLTQNIELLPTGGGPRVVVSTAAFHGRVRGSVPGLGGLKETKMFLPHPRVKVSIDRELACSASDRQGSNFKSCVWRTVSSQSSHHPQEVLLAQFSIYMCTKVA